MTIIAEKKNCEDRVIFNYPDLTEKQALKRAKAHIAGLMTKRPWGWTYKVKT